MAEALAAGMGGTPPFHRNLLKSMLLLHFVHFCRFFCDFTAGARPWGGPHEFTKMLSNGWFWYGSGTFLFSGPLASPGWPESGNLKNIPEPYQNHPF